MQHYCGNKHIYNAGNSKTQSMGRVTQQDKHNKNSEVGIKE